MTYKEFVEATICDLNQSVFEELKQLMLGEKYISFSVIDSEDVTEKILAEKICDYFAMLEFKTIKSFDKHVSAYLNNVDSIVGPHIAKTPQAKKGDKTPVAIPRARKYYEKALSIKGTKKPSITQLIDYSRIMFCLYTAVHKNEGKPISNFDYAADCLNLSKINEFMKSEKALPALPHSKKKKFETKELYSTDVSTLILSIMSLCSIIDKIEEGETNHE